MSRLAVLISLMIVLASCSHRSEFNDYRLLPREGWAYGDTLVFVPQIPDSVSEGRLQVSVCHNNNYEYTNAWLEVSADGRCDTVEMVLSDPLGHWLGSGPGTSYQVVKTLPVRLRLTNGMRVTVRHIMRVDTLRNLEGIGLGVVK